MRVRPPSTARCASPPTRPAGRQKPAFEQFGIPKGQTGPAEAMFDSVNAGWMDLGVPGTEHVAGTTRARDVFAAAQQAVTA
jgi:hypothetical protein